MNNTSNEDAVAELLTLRCHVDEYGTKFYYDKNNEWNRIHGPAIIFDDGEEQWWKDGKLHREDGPAVRQLYGGGDDEYWINGEHITEDEFIQWQKDNNKA